MHKVSKPSTTYFPRLESLPIPPMAKRRVKSKKRRKKKKSETTTTMMTRVARLWTSQTVRIAPLERKYSPPSKSLYQTNRSLDTQVLALDLKPCLRSNVSFSIHPHRADRRANLPALLRAPPPAPNHHQCKSAMVRSRAN